MTNGAIASVIFFALVATVALAVVVRETDRGIRWLVRELRRRGHSV